MSNQNRASTDPEYKIYFNGFWEGFIDNTSANNVYVFHDLLKNTLLRNYAIVDDVSSANVLIESVFGSSMVLLKDWKYKIQFSGEPMYRNFSCYDLVLFATTPFGAVCEETGRAVLTAMTSPPSNVVDFPLFSCYIHSNHFWDRLIQRPPVTKVPPQFCCFIVSNKRSKMRNLMFDRLNTYKQVHSYGKFRNNMNHNLKLDYWTEPFLRFISHYKFILCFENTKFGTYMTEKIVNPNLARIIPIYWSTHHAKRLFNMESMVFLEDESEESIQRVIEKVIYLDNNDDAYLEMVNRPFFTPEGIQYWNENYTLEKIAENMDRVIADRGPNHINTPAHPSPSPENDATPLL